MTIALLGANGFIGTRAVERWVNRGLEVRPIVRSFASLARLSRWDLDCRVADARDELALREALSGCEVVLHAVAGNADVVEGSAAPAMRAAHAAGVRRMAYLSSASVHGQDPAPGTDESSPLSDRQWSWYNNAKVRAERALASARRSGPCEVVVLRPGIVWGPRSRWVTDLFQGARSRRAYVVDGGRGVVNSVFVDNLLHAVELCWSALNIDGRTYLVQDEERMTWREFYDPLLVAAGRTWEDVWDLPAPTPRKPAMVDRVESLRGNKSVQRIVPMLPKRLKRVGKAMLAAWPEPASAEPFALPSAAVPAVDEEMVRLHRCAWRLSDERIRRDAGYRPEVSFGEGMRITLAWMREAGYPLSEVVGFPNST